MSRMQKARQNRKGRSKRSKRKPHSFKMGASWPCTLAGPSAGILLSAPRGPVLDLAPVVAILIPDGHCPVTHKIVVDHLATAVVR